ncbi:class I adenylate cyclase [Pseudomonas stutzeri]|uniref:Class I adenylate cyclase n=1 Tax=Stutzerimonas stutzeri TaxID=316 RepID=A0A2N8RY38_STUST|nr:class I adenylate cyclase [Stutzerimonas stutzeri]MCQ4296125.1 class I adenylate cyclase [Stutzerimonas stutzeri]PNF79285.1 class I adenylate cyclase [Stutzerimonas stutzeri]
MIHSQHIHPILEEGIDRKVLATLRARFLAVNSARLERTLQAMSTRQQQVLRLLPLLFHVNHPILPGYVSATTPAGLANFEPDAELLAEAQRLTRSFAYKPVRGKSPQPILGLFLMGSLGTVAQDEHSDLDVWVCHAPELDARQTAELRRKCEQLQAWAESQGSEAHFFLVDPQRFTQGQRDAQLTSDDCGTTQHYLLLDEFYRTALWLGGRTPLWWLVPDYEEHRYDEYVATLLAKRFVRGDDVLDLGHLGEVPPGEFVGAGLWQLYKAISAPYKSLFKLLLVEVYASRYPQLRCLALDFKQAIYQGRIELNELDPYIAAYQAIERYLSDRGDPERLELARRCLYLKVNRPLSRPPINRNKSWQRTLLENLTRGWHWDERQLALLDNRSHWKVRQVSQERRALVNELTYGYRFLSDFTRRLQATSPLTSRDLGVLGRRLYAAIERKAGKVEVVNLGISPDMAEDSLTLVHDYDAAGNVRWSLYQGQLTAQELPNFAPLKRSRELVALLAWCHRNGIVDGGTHLSLFPGDSGLSEAELFAIFSDLRRSLPMPLSQVDEEALLAASRPSRILLLVNVGMDPTRDIAGLANGEHSSLMTIAPENLVLSVDQVTLNSWNEMLVTRFEGPKALALCLRDFLDSLEPTASVPLLQVFCFARNRGLPVARRVEQIFEEAQQSVSDAPRGRYLLQIRQHFHMFQRSANDLRLTNLTDRPALLEHLGEAHHDFSPLRLDRAALEGDDLALMLAQGRPGCLQVFYRVAGETAELSVLDECNALWHQQFRYHDERTLLRPLMRFLESMLFRRNAQQAGQVPELVDTTILFYRIHSGHGAQPAQLERRPPPQGEINDPFYDVQAIVEAAEGGRSQVTLYCNQQEFSGLEYGAELFAAAARTIISRRRENQRYPCYITDLDLTGLHGGGRSQTVQYLRYKSRLEAALNAAIES